ncbi:MAG: hypothetical protein ABEH66_05535 [Halobacteriales archaeon]
MECSVARATELGANHGFERIRVDLGDLRGGHAREFVHTAGVRRKAFDRVAFARPSDRPLTRPR